MQKNTKIEVMKEVIQKVETFWEIAGIPTTAFRAGHSKGKLVKLISSYENIWKHKTRINFPDEWSKFLQSLDILFDIAHELYPAKMFAFSAQAGYDKDRVAKLKSLCSFNALFHV